MLIYKEGLELLWLKSDSEPRQGVPGIGRPMGTIRDH